MFVPKMNTNKNLMRKMWKLIRICRELEPPKPSKNDFLEKLEPKRIANTYLATQINYCIKEKNSKRFIRWDQYVDNNQLTVYGLYAETCSYCPASDWYSFQIEDLNENDLKIKNKLNYYYYYSQLSPLMITWLLLVVLWIEIFI